MLGLVSGGFALQLGWRGWALYLGVGNVIVNLYPILLQRYTRSRLVAVLRRSADWIPLEVRHNGGVKLSK